MTQIPVLFWLYASTAAFLLGMHATAVGPRPSLALPLMFVSFGWMAIFIALRAMGTQ